MQPLPTPATPANTPNTAGEKVSRWESEPRSSHSPTPSLSHFPTFPPAPLLHLLTCCLLLLSFQAMAAVAPPNDNCNGAIVIPATGATPFVVTTEQRDITDATPLAPNASEPPLPNTPGFDTNITRSVWYKFTPVTTGLYTVSSGPDTDTTFKDTTMVMYTSPTDCGPFSIYSFNEDSGTLRASISTNLTSGTTYYIVVWVGRLSSPDTATNEVLELQLRVSQPEAPANDTCANPIIIPPDSQLPNSQPGYLSPLIDTTLATTTANLTPPCVTNLGTRPSRDVWFQFTPAATATYILSTGSDTASVLGNDGTLINDTSIGLYTLGAGGCGQAASQIACADNSFDRAVLVANLTANTTYHIVVWDNAPLYVPGETALRLRVSPATRPTVETQPLLSISSTGAVLGASVNANGVLSRFWFEWGPTESLGSTSAVKVLLPNATTYTTNLAVSGFQRDTDYHYKIVATNALGRSIGALQTFRWNSTPPTDLIFQQEAGASVLNFTGEPFHQHLIQGTTNLVNWIDLGLATTNFTQSSSTTYFEYRHTPPPPAPAQYYYRIRLP